MEQQAKNTEYKKVFENKENIDEEVRKLKDLAKESQNFKKIFEEKTSLILEKETLKNILKFGVDFIVQKVCENANKTLNQPPVLKESIIKQTAITTRETFNNPVSRLIQKNNVCSSGIEGLKLKNGEFEICSETVKKITESNSIFLKTEREKELLQKMETVSKSLMDLEEFAKANGLQSIFTGPDLNNLEFYLNIDRYKNITPDYELFESINLK